MKNSLFKLISDNRLDDLHSLLRGENREMRYQQILFHVLENESIFYGDNKVNKDLYQQDLIEGIDIYFALSVSNLPKERLFSYLKGLGVLAFSTGEFMRAVSDRLNSEGTYLTDYENIDPNLRHSIQKLIDTVRDDQQLYKEYGNLAAGKAFISNIPGLSIEKHEIGRDMLQYADSATKLGFKEMAIGIYDAVLADFECETVRLSSDTFREMFPEVSALDTRSKKEIEVFEQAREQYEKLLGKKLPDVKRAHINNDPNARVLMETANPNGPTFRGNEERLSFFEKLKRLFRRFP